GGEHGDAMRSMSRAIAERAARDRVAIRLVEAPVGYVSGESTAVVHYLNTGDARPTSTLERPFERGVGSRPTLVQNVESLALAEAGLGFGCGLFGFLEANACGVRATEQIVRYMAAQSARQCGPCIFGLGAMAAALERLSSCRPQADDLEKIARWSAQITGRGA